MKKKIVIQHLMLKHRLEILLQDIKNVKQIIKLKQDFNILIEKCMLLKIQIKS